LEYSVELVNVSKHFGKIRALDKVSLGFPAKKITTILGPSGSGKTTLLKIIAGLITPDQGKVYILGKDFTEIPPWKRPISMVFQNPALIPTMKGRENICLPLRKCPKEKIRDLARMLDIEHVLDRYPEQMSGGEQQRVAIARALITEPEILLLDEPFAHLDAIIKESLIRDLTKILRELGITVIHVTHDQDEALTISDYLAIITQGRIIEFGKTEDVYERPRTSLGAKFLRHNFVVLGDKMYRFPPEAVRIENEGEFSGRVVECIKKRGYWLLRIEVEDGEGILECAYYKRIGIGERVRFNVNKELLSSV